MSEISSSIPFAASAVAKTGRQPNQLTPKEKEVLRRYARGEQVPQIAKDLDIHIQSVYQRLDRAKNRTGYESLAGLVHYAIKEGLVTMGDAR